MEQILSLSEELGRQLMNKGWKITTAESCTGGGISSAITEVAGSSVYFDRAFVTYSNKAKSDMLDIPLLLIDKYGAVSKETVEAMALGAMIKAEANVAISVSGIAGPGGGTLEKPVGTVWVGIAIQYLLDKKVKSTVYSEKCLFRGDRQKIRLDSIKYCINKTLEIIK